MTGLQFIDLHVKHWVDESIDKRGPRNIMPFKTIFFVTEPNLDQHGGVQLDRVGHKVIIRMIPDLNGIMKSVKPQLKLHVSFDLVHIFIGK